MFDIIDYLKAIFEIAKDTDRLTPDGIVSFFGALLGALIAGFIAIQVSKNQSKKDIERERTIISEKLKLDTYLELNNALMEYQETVKKQYHNYYRYDKEYIKYKEYGDKHNEFTSQILPALDRKISGLMVVFDSLTKEYNNIRKCYQIFFKMMFYSKASNNPKKDISKKIFDDDTKQDKELVNNLNRLYEEDSEQATKQYYKEHQRLVDQLLERVRTYLKCMISETKETKGRWSK